MAKAKFSWKKLGRVFVPDGRFEWMQSHSQNPSALLLDDRIRVYFTCRGSADADGMFAAVTTFVDLDRQDPTRVVHVNDRPLLPLGGVGAFDQYGVMPGNVVRVGNEVFLYYVGWMRTEGAPYIHAIGLAISEDEGATFRRYAEGPLFGRTPREPFLQNSPFVGRFGDMFHMWYSSGIAWIDDGGRAESIYVMMHATSRDGIEWHREGVPCLPTVLEHEVQTNPSVIRVGNRYYMWFCYLSGIARRTPGRGYRMGVAWSDDLVTWHRDDTLGVVTPSEEGWDSEMICYPGLFECDGRRYMLYSGNYFGRDGFGIAIQDGGEAA
jgi:hypothetical protein